MASSQAEAQQMQSFVRQLQEKYLAANKRLHSFHRPGEGHLVGAEKTWCEGVDRVTDVGDVCQCPKLCSCW